MPIRVLRAALWPAGLALALLVAGCERDRTLERTRRHATGEGAPTADATPTVGQTSGEIELVQDRGRASWGLVELPAAPAPDPEAPDASDTDTDEPAADERQSPFPPVEGFDEALAAVPALLQQASARPGQGEGFTTGRGDLVLQLENRPEPAPSDNANQAAAATPDRLRMTLDVSDGQGPAIRIEPVRTVGLAEQGAYAAWGPWPSTYAAWFVGNVVVDQRTVDQNHLMYLHAEPVAGATTGQGGDAAPTYNVHVIVLPVLIEGTVPQMQELAAADRLAGEPAKPEQDGAAEPPEEAATRRALHLVLLDVQREGRRTAALTPQ